ncbi:MAG: Rv3654c family TadE-like protein [Nocardioidaceae bacterium]
MTGANDSGRRADRSRDAGVATVWAVGWMFTCLAVGWVSIIAAMAVARQHQLDASADLASLSGASHLQHGHDACQAVARTAAANQVALTECRVQGEDVFVVVESTLKLPAGQRLRLVATARAGPV